MIDLSKHDARADELLARMTLREKLGQMSQFSVGFQPVPECEKAAREGRVGSFINCTSPQLRNRLQRIAVEESRLGIPLLFGRDVIHGYRTMFPIPLAQACSFDTELIEEGARVAAREAASVGIDWALAPMVDVTRDPRWGRIAETAGEDALLGAALGAALVRGFQGPDFSDPERVVACAKHYICYGASESGKDYNTALVPEQTLRELHLPPFRACVAAGVGTIMSAFSELNGVPASANAFTLREILKLELGFSGFVVSDWASVTETITHGLCENERAAAREAALAGVDMEMATHAFSEHLESLLEAREVSLSVIDDAVRRILRVKLQRGLFERPYVDLDRPSPLLSPEHLAVAQRLAEESAVLLKNDGNLLPLSPALRRLAVIGSLADSALDQLGTWTIDGKPEDAVTTLTALRQRFPELELRYEPGTPSPRSTDTSGIERAVAAAREADVVLLFAGEDQAISGESKSRAFLDLPGAQAQLIRAVAATGKPLVLVVMAGRPLTIGADIEHAQALLWAWHNGSMGGPALVRLLFGERAPSGKLAVSFPRSVGQIPVYYAHKQTGRPLQQGQREPGVPLGTPLDPVGFASCYLDVENSPLFPFGFGLSYSRVEYSDLRVRTPSVVRDGTLEVSAQLTCAGEHAIEEVAQLYTRDLVASVTRPVRELKGFQRVRLAPGETRRVTFQIPSTRLAFPGRSGELVLEPGAFHVWVGGSSDADLRGDFRLI
jgi:beta-glucosidase